MFDEFSSSRVSLRKELEDGHNHAWANVLAHYVSLLLGMLKHQVLRHAFTTATATLETVSMAMDRVPDIMRTVGVAVLSHETSHVMTSQHGAGSGVCGLWQRSVEASHGGDVVGQESVGYRETLQMLKLMFTWLPRQRVSILLETAAFIAAHGNLQEAYATLQSQISSDPFKCDVMVHGYSAVLQYLMWRKEAGLQREGVWSEEEEGGAESSKAKALSKQALQHFTAMENLDPPPSRHMDTFIAVHSELLAELGHNEEALDLLVSYRDAAPHRLSAAMLVCDHVEVHGASDEVYCQHLSAVVALDDSSVQALQLAKITVSKPDDEDDEVRYEKVLKLLLDFLSYPHNTGNSLAQKLLDAVQQQWPDYQSSDLWMTRHSTWPLGNNTNTS